MEIDKIICGDCYELIKAIPDKSVDLIITDPPYEIVAGGEEDVLELVIGITTLNTNHLAEMNI